MARTMTFAQTGALEKTLSREEKALIKELESAYKEADSKGLRDYRKKEILQNKAELENITFGHVWNGLRAYLNFFAAYDNAVAANIDEEFMYITANSDDMDTLTKKLSRSNDMFKDHFDNNMSREEIEKKYGSEEEFERQLLVEEEERGVKRNKLKLEDLNREYRENYDLLFNWYKKLSENDKLFVMGNSKERLYNEVKTAKTVINDMNLSEQEKSTLAVEIDNLTPKVSHAYDEVMRSGIFGLLFQAVVMLIIMYVGYKVIDWILPSVVAYLWLLLYPIAIIRNFSELNAVRSKRNDGFSLNFLLAIFGVVGDNKD